MSAYDEGENREAGERRERTWPSRESFCDEIETFIAEKPLQSLGIALLAGIIVGKIIL